VVGDAPHEPDTFGDDGGVVVDDHLDAAHERGRVNGRSGGGELRAAQVDGDTAHDGQGVHGESGRVEAGAAGRQLHAAHDRGRVMAWSRCPDASTVDTVHDRRRRTGRALGRTVVGLAVSAEVWVGVSRAGTRSGVRSSVIQHRSRRRTAA